MRARNLKDALDVALEAKRLSGEDARGISVRIVFDGGIAEYPARHIEKVTRHGPDVLVSGAGDLSGAFGMIAARSVQAVYVGFESDDALGEGGGDAGSYL